MVQKNAFQSNSIMLELNQEQKELARVLLNSDDYIKDFYINFHKRNKDIIDDLLDFREKRLQESKITIEKFLNMCYNGDMLIAFETCFLQPMDLLQLSMVYKAIEEDRTSLEIIFNEFQKNPNRNILKNVL